MTVCKKEFRAELERSIAAGAMTERFVELAESSARLWLLQSSTSGWSWAADDVMSLFHVRLVRKWQTLDPQRNLFAWCITTVRRCSIDFSRKHTGRNWRHEKAAKKAARLEGSLRS